MAIPPLTRRTVVRGGFVTVIGGIAGYLTVRAGGAAGTSGTAADAYGTTGAGTTTPLLALGRLPAGSVVVLAGARIVLARRPGGEVHAFSAVCTHQGCTVALTGHALVCPCHGSTFTADTGAVIHGPASRPLPPVPVVVRNGEVYRS